MQLVAKALNLLLQTLSLHLLGWNKNFQFAIKWCDKVQRLYIVNLSDMCLHQHTYARNHSVIIYVILLGIIIIVITMLL